MPGKPKRHTFFGVTPPIWQAESVGNGPCTITFVLEGRVISKKNNQMAVVKKIIARDYLAAAKKQGQILTYEDVEKALGLTEAVFVGNKLYNECRDTFLPILAAQKQVWSERLAAKGLKFPLKKAAMSLRFYFKDKYKTDTVNKQQTIQDLLQEAGIIAGDDYNVLNPITAASGLYKNRIRENITVIRLTFQLPKSKVKLTDTLK